VVERALMSPHAPYAVVLDCVGGTDLIPYMDHLVLDDPKAPHLGHYITIVGDSMPRLVPIFIPGLIRRNKPRFHGRTIHLCESPHRHIGLGTDVKLTHPIQNVRYYRGKLHDLLPRWTPLRSLIVNRRYEVYMCSPSTEQFSTIAEFYATAKKVVIDSTFSFEVSLLSAVSIRER
jgi:hypothetical protein